MTSDAKSVAEILAGTDPDRPRALVVTPSMFLDKFDRLTDTLRLVGFEVFNFSVVSYKDPDANNAEKIRFKEAVLGVDVILTDGVPVIGVKEFETWVAEAELPVCRFNVFYDGDDDPRWSKLVFDDDQNLIARKARALVDKRLASQRKIFISYSRVDEQVATDIYERLRRRYNVWFDRSSLRGGVNWEAVIEDNLEGSEKIVLLLSSEALTKRGFFHVELQLLDDLRRYFPPDYPYIIPVLLNQCQMPRFLRKIHALDAWELGDKVIDRLQAAIEG